MYGVENHDLSPALRLAVQRQQKGGGATLTTRRPLFSQSTATVGTTDNRPNPISSAGGHSPQWSHEWI